MISSATSSWNMPNTPANAEETLARWRAEEAAVRARLGPAGVCRPEQLAGKTGAQVFEAIFSGELPHPHMNETLGFVPMHMEPRYAVFQGRPQVAHYNPM